MYMFFWSADLVETTRYHAALLPDVFCVPNIVLCFDSPRHCFNKMHAPLAAYLSIFRLGEVSTCTTERLYGHLE